MVTKCIVVADASRARIFTAPMTPDARLRELEDLVLPVMNRPQHERYEGSRSASHASGPNHGHALDDHRDRHDLEVERKFATDVARLAFEHTGAGLVLVAPPKMLGVLRPIIEEMARAKGTKVESLARELTKLPPEEIAAHLRSEGMLR